MIIVSIIIISSSSNTVIVIVIGITNMIVNDNVCIIIHIDMNIRHLMGALSDRPPRWLSAPGGR